MHAQLETIRLYILGFEKDFGKETKAPLQVWNVSK